MLNGDFAQDGVSVVGHDDAAHGVHEHLEHGLGTETGADDITNLNGGLDVLTLDLEELLKLRITDVVGNYIVHKVIQPLKK